MEYKSNIKETKDLYNSKYHGVRPDKRKSKIWYRASICLNKKKIYLGAYEHEDYAAYAFNIAASIFLNKKCIIWNKIQKSVLSESTDIEKKVITLLLKKNYIIKNNGRG